jgi:hypothetical protein
MVFGLRNAVLTHPDDYASYAVPVKPVLSVVEVSVQVFVVPLTSVHGSLQTTLRLTNASGN